jgi:hypothetical protein
MAHRYSSVFNNAYPWRNGLILEQGPLVPWVTTNAPYGVPAAKMARILVRGGCSAIVFTQMNTDSHQTLARDIDKFDVDGIRAHSHGVTLREWMATDPYQPVDYTNAESAFIGQAYLGYQLLDMMVWSCHWPRHPRLVHRPTTIEHVEDCDRVKGVINDFLSGLDELPGFIQSLSADAGSSIPAHPIFDATTTTSRAALENLRRAEIHGSNMDKHDILSLIYAVAFVMGWFLPSDTPNLIRDIIYNVKKRCETLRVSMPHLKQDRIREHLGVIQWALGISPLVLFLPRLGIRSSMAQHSKLRAFATMGSRSTELADIDQTFWSSIFSLAVGIHSVDAVVTTAQRISDSHQIKYNVDQNWQKATFAACSKPLATNDNPATRAPPTPASSPVRPTANGARPFTEEPTAGEGDSLLLLPDPGADPIADSGPQSAPATPAGDRCRALVTKCNPYETTSIYTRVGNDQSMGRSDGCSCTWPH